MKKIKFLVIISILLLVSGCSIGKDAKDLKGVWELDIKDETLTQIIKDKKKSSRPYQIMYISQIKKKNNTGYTVDSRYLYNVRNNKLVLKDTSNGYCFEMIDKETLKQIPCTDNEDGGNKKDYGFTYKKSKDKEIVNFSKNSNNSKYYCDAFKDIKDAGNNYLITNDGSLYEMNWNKLYSNNQNCRKIDTDIKFSRILGWNFLLGEDGNLYHEKENYDSSTGKVVSKNIELYYNIDSSYKNILENLVSDFSYDGNINYYDKDNNNLYKCKNKYTNIYNGSEYKTNIEITDCEVIQTLSLAKDEKVEYVSYKTLKTNKKIYKYSKVTLNKEECEAYADVKCKNKYQFVEVTKKNVVNNIDKILFRNGSILIDIYGMNHNNF